VHLFCTGTGAPTIVLEAGLGDFSVQAWSTVQPKLSLETRVCSYDRAGMGWSDPSPEPFLPDQTVADLHAVLSAARERPPFVLVGQSYGALLARHYTSHYPAEVAGLVLLDGTHEEQMTRMPPDPPWLPLAVSALRVVNWLGVDRVASGSGADTIAAIAVARNTRPESMGSVIDFFPLLASVLAQVRRDATDFGDLPLVVIVKGTVNPDPGQTPEEAQRAQDVWIELQREVAARSTRGELLVAERSGHHVQWDRPDLVIAKVREVVSTVRRERDLGTQ
jgi:pimeloyl-ACP methyl ester carboxylesterase